MPVHTASQWVSGFTAEGPMFWTLIALLLCLVFMRNAQIAAARQSKMEAESARRQEQTYQAMVQHYRQVAMEQHQRSDHSHPGQRGSGSSLEAVQLLVESNMARSARLEARAEALTKELEELRRMVAGCEGMTSALFSSVSDLHHKFNGLNHAVQGLTDSA
ncbi:MAG: hypothetical protein RL514_941 [Verrucomicrobiota bacterium]